MARSERRSAWSCCPHAPGTPGSCAAVCPDAARRVAKVWRKSWNLTSHTPAARQAALKRLLTFERSSGCPVWGCANTRSPSLRYSVRLDQRSSSPATSPSPIGRNVSRPARRVGGTAPVCHFTASRHPCPDLHTRGRRGDHGYRAKGTWSNGSDPDPGSHQAAPLPPCQGSAYPSQNCAASVALACRLSV